MGTPASTTVYNGDYCRIELRNSNRTIIAFSAINCPVGKFHGSRALQDVDCNMVFINCPRNSWYLDGIPGLGGNIEDAAEALRGLLVKFGLSDTRIMTWGGSMGGYGAVVFGSLLNAEAIIATGAEIELLIPGGNSELILKSIQRRIDIEKPDISRILAQANSRISLYVGEFFYPDLVSALQVANRPATTITTLRDFGHPLPGYLNDTYGLGEFILHHFDEHDSFPFQHEEVGCMTSFTEHWRSLHDASLGHQQTATEYLATLVKNCPHDELRMHCHHSLSMGASAMGDYRLAFHEAEQAVNAWPQSCFAQYQYAMAMKNAGYQPKKWLKVCMDIPNIHQPSRFSNSERLLNTMVFGFKKAGWIDRGVHFFRHLMNLRGNTAASSKMLASFIRQLSQKKSCHVIFDTRARAELLGYLLDSSVVTVRNGCVHLSGVLVFPVDCEPPSFRGEGLTIETLDTCLASPGYGRKFKDHPMAGRSRFRMEVRLENPDISTIYAYWHGGHSLPILHLKPVQANAGIVTEPDSENQATG
jgi:hypothetical protein